MLNEFIKHQLNIFLEEYPLYKNFLAVEKYEPQCEGYTNPIYLHGETFDYFCENENEIKTFELTIPKKTIDYWGKKTEGNIPNEVFNSNDKLNYTEHFTGICKSCKKYNIDFLLQIWSDEIIPKREIPSISKIIENHKNGAKDKTANIYIQKIGVYPEIKPSIDKTILKYFDRETSNWYFKAVKSLNENFGIGSFAYFRRIVEKELIQIINDLSHLDSSDSLKIQGLLSKYNETDKIYLIYENIFEYLPSSLRGLGDNPFQLLYKQTSKGLHNLSESECLKRASNINILLKFVILKINEEKSEILKIRNIIKELNR
jgi:hypothetical protein